MLADRIVKHHVRVGFLNAAHECTASSVRKCLFQLIISRPWNRFNMTKLSHFVHEAVVYNISRLHSNTMFLG